MRFLPTEVWLQLKLAGSLILVLLDHVYLLKKKEPNSFSYLKGKSTFIERPLVSYLISFNYLLLLLLLLSRFSRVRLCATPKTAAHRAPPSLGFSRQEHWSGLPFPSPMHESESEVAQSCPTLSDPRDCSLPGSSVHGIFQARVLEWAFNHHYCLIGTLIQCELFS